MGVALWWACRLGGDLGACPMSSSWGLRIIGPMRALYWRVFYFGFASAMFLNSNTSLSMYFFCKPRIHVTTLCSDHVCVVLCVNALVLAPRMDPIYDWPPLLRCGMSQLVSESYEYNTTLTVIFSKTYGEDTLQCPYKDYSSLDRWQANRDLLSVFTFFNLLFATTYLRQGKKVSILMPADVNSSPVASRRGLLEAVPIVR
jgi:hypothetical protein